MQALAGTSQNTQIRWNDSQRLHILTLPDGHLMNVTRLDLTAWRKKQFVVGGYPITASANLRGRAILTYFMTHWYKSWSSFYIICARYNYIWAFSKTVLQKIMPLLDNWMNWEIETPQCGLLPSPSVWVITTYSNVSFSAIYIPTNIQSERARLGLDRDAPFALWILWKRLFKD